MDKFDADNTEWLTKLDVVERQLKEAIELFYERRDIVTIHTIVASAHQILFDLANIEDVESFMKNKNKIPSDEFWQHIKNLNFPYNFFKHADRDPDEKINIAPLKRISADFLLDGILMFQSIQGNLFIEGKIFWAWYLSNYKEDFEDISNEPASSYLMGLELGDKSFEWILNLIRFGNLTQLCNE